jgi:ATP-binding cassette subfamily C protein LapB
MVSHSPTLLSACDFLYALDRGKLALAGPAREILPRLFGGKAPPPKDDGPGKGPGGPGGAPGGTKGPGGGAPKPGAGHAIPSQIIAKPASQPGAQPQAQTQTQPLAQISPKVAAALRGAQTQPQAAPKVAPKVAAALRSAKPQAQQQPQAMPKAAAALRSTQTSGASLATPSPRPPAQKPQPKIDVQLRGDKRTKLSPLQSNIKPAQRPVAVPDINGAARPVLRSVPTSREKTADTIAPAQPSTPAPHRDVKIGVQLRPSAAKIISNDPNGRKPGSTRGTGARTRSTPIIRRPKSAE